MKATLLFLCFTLLAGSAKAADDDLSRIPVLFARGSQVTPLVSIYTEGLYPGGRVSVIACIWPDGRIVWSRNRSEGGRPYFTGYVQPPQLKHLLANLRTSGLFARKVWFGVITDAPSEDHAYIIDGGHRVALTATGGAYSARKSSLPKHITEAHDTMAFLYQQVEPILPLPGQKLRSFSFDLRSPK